MCLHISRLEREAVRERPSLDKVFGSCAERPSTRLGPFCISQRDQKSALHSGGRGDGVELQGQRYIHQNSSRFETDDVVFKRRSRASPARARRASPLLGPVLANQRTEKRGPMERNVGGGRGGGGGGRRVVSVFCVGEQSKASPCLFDGGCFCLFAPPSKR